MPRNRTERDIFRDLLTYEGFRGLNETEVRILGTIIRERSGNAYSLWKASGLKHYPTALRTVKKLQEKQLVHITGEGMRGERIFAPTLFGTLMYYALRRDETQLIRTIALNSDLFQQMLDAEVMERTPVWAYDVVRQMASDVVRGKPRSIDDIVRYQVSEGNSEDLLNLHNQRYKDRVTRLAKIEWVREQTLEDIEREMKWCQKQIQELRKLKNTLTEK